MWYASFSCDIHHCHVIYTIPLSCYMHDCDLIDTIVMWYAPLSCDIHHCHVIYTIVMWYASLSCDNYTPLWFDRHHCHVTYQRVTWHGTFWAGHVTIYYWMSVFFSLCVITRITSSNRFWLWCVSRVYPDMRTAHTFPARHSQGDQVKVNYRKWDLPYRAPWQSHHNTLNDAGPPLKHYGHTIVFIGL